jgi:hypothetical protein
MNIIHNNVYPDDGISKILRNVGKFPLVYTVSRPRKHQISVPFEIPKHLNIALKGSLSCVPHMAYVLATIYSDVVSSDVSV